MKKNIRKFLLAALFAAFAVNNAFADDSTYTDTTNVKKAQIAMATNEYIVTAGDIYSLVYNGSSLSVAVDSTYRVRIASLGVINAKGLTLQEFKSKVETLIVNNYPTAAVQLFLSNPSEFNVYVKGEVSSAGTYSSWALERVASVISSMYTSYSSTRFVTIISADGVEKQYDLYKYTRYGELDQNPYMRPGDTIIVPKIERSVSITGSVRRTGTYELLPGEELNELITEYANGFDDYANKNAISLSRFVGGQVMYVDSVIKETDLHSTIPLSNKDKVYVASLKDSSAIVYVEGAVNKNYNYETKSGSAGEANGTVTTSPTTTGILKIPYSEGMTCRTLVIANPDMFLNSADYKTATLIRLVPGENGKITEEKIDIDLDDLLHNEEGAAQNGGIPLKPNDRLVIPFSQYYVTVTGGVVSPGRYSYQPNRDWTYYVNLAMGFDYDQALFKIVKITDKNGKRLSKKSEIPPEAVIYAQRNSPKNGWVIPLLTAIMSFATALLTFLSFAYNWKLTA